MSSFYMLLRMKHHSLIKLYAFTYDLSFINDRQHIHTRNYKNKLKN